MADITPTLIQKIITEYQAGTNDKYELRDPNAGALNAFLDDTDMISSNRGIITSQERMNIMEAGYSPNGTGIPVIKKKNVIVNNTGTTTCEANQEAADTDLADVTYSTLAFDLKIPIGDYDYNYVGLNSALATELIAASIAVTDALDTLVVTALEAGKNQVIAPNTLGYWTAGTDVFQIAEASAGQMYNYKRATFSKMRFKGPWRDIYNWEHEPFINNQFAQGSGNAVNQQYQFTGSPSIPAQSSPNLTANWAFYGDDKVVNDGGSGAKTTSYSFPQGSVAILNSVDKKYPVSGIRDYQTVEYSRASLPMLPDFQFGVKRKIVCDPATGLDIENWQFEMKVAIVLPYNSDPTTNEGAINKFEIIP